MVSITKSKVKKPTKSSHKSVKKTLAKRTKSKKAGNIEKGPITKETNINEIVGKYPGTIEVFFKHGFYCIGCQAAAFESLEQGAKAHGMGDELIEQMVKEMNETIKKNK